MTWTVIIALLLGLFIGFVLGAGLMSLMCIASNNDLEGDGDAT